jgi:hypothetical protein
LAGRRAGSGSTRRAASRADGARQRLGEGRADAPEGHPDGEEVRSCIERRPTEELRGQVVRGSSREAVRPHAHGPRAAEIDERAGAVLADQDVLRLEVAVQHPRAVQQVERAQGVAERSPERLPAVALGWRASVVPGTKSAV